MSPWAPRRPCPTAGCRALITRDQKRCATCERTYNAARMAEPLHVFYTQRPWRTCRAEYLAAHPTCEAPGCPEPATRVDHRTPLREGGAPFDWANLTAYCHQHDSEKSARRGERWGR